MKGDNRISTDSLRQRIKDKNKIKQMINESENNLDNIYIIFCVFYLIVNAFFIFVWMMLYLPLYYKINKVNYLQMRKRKREK